MVRESGLRRPFFLRSSENGSSPIFCFQANEGPLKGYLRAARISEALLPSTALKRNSDRFVFSDLYRIAVPRLYSTLHTQSESNKLWLVLPSHNFLASRMAVSEDAIMQNPVYRVLRISLPRTSVNKPSARTRPR